MSLRRFFLWLSPVTARVSLLGVQLISVNDPGICDSNLVQNRESKSTCLFFGIDPAILFPSSYLIRVISIVNDNTGDCTMLDPTVVCWIAFRINGVPVAAERFA